MNLDLIKKTGIKNELQKEILERLDTLNRCCANDRQIGVMTGISPDTTINHMSKIARALDDLKALLAALSEQEPEKIRTQAANDALAKELFNSVFGAFFNTPVVPLIPTQGTK